MRLIFVITTALSLACSGFGGFSAKVDRPAASAVTADLQVLDALDDEDLRRLEQHLTASAAWTVTDEHDRRVATRSWRVRRAWEPGSNGYWSDFAAEEGCPEVKYAPDPVSPRCASADIVQGRVLIALGNPETLTHQDRGQFTTAPLSGEVTLALEDYMDQPGRNSWLVLQGERLMVEVMEQAEPDERPFTQAALDGLRQELLAVIEYRDEIDRQGFVGRYTPQESWTRGGGPDLLLIAAERPGRYSASILANPGVPGVLGMRLVFLGASEAGEAPSGLSVGDEVPINYQLPRRLGWGRDAAVRFATSAPLWVERGTPGQVFRGRLEVVHHPDDGGPAVVVASVEQDFTGREPLTPPSPQHGGERR